MDRSCFPTYIFPFAECASNVKVLAADSTTEYNSFCFLSEVLSGNVVLVYQLKGQRTMKTSSYFHYMPKYVSYIKQGIQLQAYQNNDRLIRELEYGRVSLNVMNGYYCFGITHLSTVFAAAGRYIACVWGLPKFPPKPLSVSTSCSSFFTLPVKGGVLICSKCNVCTIPIVYKLLVP